MDEDVTWVPVERGKTVKRKPDFPASESGTCPSSRDGDVRGRELMVETGLRDYRGGIDPGITRAQLVFVGPWQ